MALEDQFKAWAGSLSTLDQQLLRDHALDPTPPDKVIDLLKYGPVKYAGWFETDPPAFFYPEELLSALGAARSSGTAAVD